MSGFLMLTGSHFASCVNGLKMGVWTIERKMGPATCWRNFELIPKILDHRNVLRQLTSVVHY